MWSSASVIENREGDQSWLCPFRRWLKLWGLSPERCMHKHHTASYIQFGEGHRFPWRLRTFFLGIDFVFCFRITVLVLCHVRLFQYNYESPLVECSQFSIGELAANVVLSSVGSVELHQYSNIHLLETISKGKECFAFYTHCLERAVLQHKLGIQLWQERSWWGVCNFDCSGSTQL